MAFQIDAAKIKRWRQERHWSQEHLADLAGLALRTVQRIENGEKASQETVMALAAAFEIEAMALSLDVEDEARLAASRKAEEAEARMRLMFYFHAASVVVVMAIFAFLAAISGDWAIMKITLWFILPLVVHGVSIFVIQLSDRHERKFGKVETR